MIQNCRKYKDSRLVTNWQDANKFIKKHNVKDFRIFSENLVSINMNPITVTLNRLPAVGASILELSKIIMYRFFYDVLRPVYGSDVGLVYMDTDSFLLKINTPNWYADIERHFKTHMDTSNFPRDHRLYDPSTRCVLGLFKDETPGTYISAFCGLRAKLYSYISNAEEHKRCKGISRSTTKHELRYCLYEDALLQRMSYNHKSKLIRAKDFRLTTQEVNKRSLSR